MSNSLKTVIFMKNLEFNQMENLNGGDQRNCMIIGFTILGSALAQRWDLAVAGVLTGAAFECF